MGPWAHTDKRPPPLIFIAGPPETQNDENNVTSLWSLSALY